MISSDDTHSSTKRPSNEGKEEGGLVVSRFRIELPTNEARVGRVPSSEEDTDDGEDRVPEHQEITTSPPRRKRKRRQCSQNGQKSKTLTLTLAHSLRTSLELVGLQVWGAAFPLLDYVILNSDRFKGKKVIEIGCGTGVLSIILAYVGADVIATDYDNRVLCLANRNIEANSHIIHPEFIVSKDEPFGIRQENTVQVCKLDWLAKHIDCPVSMFLLTGLTTECGSDLATQWQEHNLNMFKDADYFCASDIIYDDFLTDSLFKKLSLWLTGGKVMAPEGGDASDGKLPGWQSCEGPKTLVLSIEKRYNFEARSCSVEAHGYKNFQDWMTGSKVLAITTNTDDSNHNDTFSQLLARTEHIKTSEAVFGVPSHDIHQSTIFATFQGERVFPSQSILKKCINNSTADDPEDCDGLGQRMANNITGTELDTCSTEIWIIRVTQWQKKKFNK